MSDHQKRRDSVVRSLRTIADQIESGEFDASLAFRDEMVGVRQPEVRGDLVIEVIGTRVHGLAILICGHDATLPINHNDRLTAALEVLVPKPVNLDDIILGGDAPYTRRTVEEAALAYHKKE